MTARVQKWGNSLAVRIPRAVALDTRLSPGDEVEMRLRKGAIVIMPLGKPKPRLEDLLKGVSRANIHHETPTGGALGLEIW